MSRVRGSVEPTGSLADGQRIGRYVIMRDIDGYAHAVSASAVCAISATDDGALVMLPGARTLHVGARMETILRWLDGRP